MLDIQFIRENPELVAEVTRKKNKDPQLIDQLLKADEARRSMMTQVQQVKAEKNKLTQADRQKGKQLKSQLKQLEPELAELETQFETLLKQIPNIIADDVPEGKDESENVVIDTWGKIPEFDFTPKDHVSLGEALDILDVKTAAQVTGARFGYLKGDLALLQFGLIQYTFGLLTDSDRLQQIADTVEPGYSARPFIPVIPPVMIRPEVFDRMDRLKPEEDRFYIQSDDKYLIGSAEHTLGPLHMDQTLSEKDLPLRYVGYSTSFRREAGSYGKDTRGILRVHQFDKIEMESFTVPENSVKEQDFFVAIQENLIQSLMIPYQKVMICTGDMGKPDFRQIDLEAWIPSQQKYRETHTADLMTDYQARRLNTKVQRKGGQKQLVHMNDATAFALGRILIAIMENYQLKNGQIGIPKVLQPYIGKKVIG